MICLHGTISYLLESLKILGVQKMILTPLVKEFELYLSLMLR